MSEISKLVPAMSERAILIGTTGCGKTTLAYYLLIFRPFVIVYDAKNTINWDGYKRVKTLKKLVAAKEEKLIYAPSPEDSRNKDLIEKFFAFIYKRRNTTCYVDELTSVSDSYYWPDRLQDCIQRGRERGIEIWSATQRPSLIPNMILSESENFYCFWQKLEPDRKKTEQVTGIEREKIQSLKKREFYYSTVHQISNKLMLDL